MNAGQVLRCLPVTVDVGLDEVAAAYEQRFNQGRALTGPEMMRLRRYLADLARARKVHVTSAGDRTA